jgi:hypothetical protein
MIRTAWLAVPTLVVAALLTGRPSDAQKAEADPGPSDPELEQKKEEARAYFLEGVDLFDDKDYAQALEKFKLAFDLVPHWSSRYNIGMCHYYLGDHPQAIVELLAFLEEGETEAPDEMTLEAGKIIDLIRGQHVATITVSGVGDQAEVTVDGEAPAAVSGDGEIFLVPGPHAFKVTQDGEVLLEDEITAKAGESKELRVYVKEVQTEPVKTEETKSAGPRPLAAAGWAAVGLAGASLVICAVTGGLVISKKNEIGDLEKKYGDAPPGEQAAIRKDAADLYDEGVVLGNVSTAFFVITAAAAAAGTALLVVDSRREKKTGATVSLAASPGGILIQGSF